MFALSFRAALDAPFLDVEEERQAISRWQEYGDQNSLEILLRSHVRQAYAQARRWASNPVELEDLVAEGIIGLMRAAERFDLTQDVRFSTYSHWWVMTCVLNALARIKTVIDVPARVYLDARMGRLDNPEASQLLTGLVALDAKSFDDSDADLMEMMPSPDLTPEEQTLASSAAQAAHEVLSSALDDLDAPDREIVLRRKLQTPPESLDDLARDLGISRERARQVEKRALLRLKRCLEKRGFSPAMLN
ncbi:hypothetical protein BMG03_03225 [Thioclava nitratireducens]|uniref:RNA polymerase sigma-70 domain-containing protein n=1 Tax=Thioclava nitratireducens TaxID=1915078 RepID=A0ABM6IE09_9RHOB|nr:MULTISPECIES: sigma-70 family RNA polymerase sigma factor [Thioclava]AQS46917.1 hypothetical protein BMG03_03225 [Thioclava nitratireducens]OWY01228.1 hypothetical protein B6V75_16605 [Thioclava sp. F1Mire-8]OWY08554.1 hypothetical protein B6V74_11995 [Thioclava sp. F42-5]OWY11716.1 hypothetical protein B6V72_15370 [Thioclava sp. F34-6]